jgi:hypothetical protein
MVATEERKIKARSQAAVGKEVKDHAKGKGAAKSNEAKNQ